MTPDEAPIEMSLINKIKCVNTFDPFSNYFIGSVATKVDIPTNKFFKTIILLSLSKKKPPKYL